MLEKIDESISHDTSTIEILFNEEHLKKVANLAKTQNRRNTVLGVKSLLP